MARVTDLIKSADRIIASGQAASLAHPKYARSDNAYAGLSYIAAEAVYHTAGGMRSGLRPHLIHVDTNEIHFYLVDADGKVHDPTARQFSRKIDYTFGRPSGFMSPQPSQRACDFMALLEAQS